MGRLLSVWDLARGSELNDSRQFDCDTLVFQYEEWRGGHAREEDDEAKIYQRENLEQKT